MRSPGPPRSPFGCQTATNSCVRPSGPLRTLPFYTAKLFLSLFNLAFSPPFIVVSFFLKVTFPHTLELSSLFEGNFSSYS